MINLKHYNKILEAVNRGIRLALDDFDNEVPIALGIDKVKSKDLTSDWLDLMACVVDLGLPSGTLWCKYNLGVNPNKLETQLDWAGKYYAWGEIEEKDIYNWETYKFYNSFEDIEGYTKYCNDEAYGLVDNKTKLDLEDDAAYQCHKYKERFCIPTSEQFLELLEYTTTKNIKFKSNKSPEEPFKHLYISNLPSYHTDYQKIQNITGTVFTSKINGEELFIPDGGFLTMVNSENKILNLNNSYYLWTSELDKSPDDATCFTSCALIPFDRTRGINIRPVLIKQ